MKWDSLLIKCISALSITIYVPNIKQDQNPAICGILFLTGSLYFCLKRFLAAAQNYKCQTFIYKYNGAPHLLVRYIAAELQNLPAGRQVFVEIMPINNYKGAEHRNIIHI
jgi:hypothetical protein